MTTLATIPVGTRTGTFGPMSAAVPAGLHRLSIVTDTESLWDVGDSIDVLFEVSFDGGVTWKHEASATGMAPSVDSPHVALSVSFGNANDGPSQSGIPDPYPTHARFTVTHHGSVRYGATVTVD